MPLFYFDIEGGNEGLRDDDGEEFPDLAQAVEAAKQSGLEFAEDLIAIGRGLDHITIIVRDEHRAQVYRSLLSHLLSAKR